VPYELIAKCSLVLQFVDKTFKKTSSNIQFRVLIMVEKSVTDMIFEKFAQIIAGDSLFKGISKEIVALMREKPGKDEIKALLERIDNENSKS
jgi:hypothetical protein